MLSLGAVLSRTPARCVAKLLLIALAGCVPASHPTGPIPIARRIEVHRTDDTHYVLELLAPTATSRGQARAALLMRARALAQEAGATFAVTDERWSDNVRIMPLASGEIVIAPGPHYADWQRYWRLYRHEFFVGPFDDDAAKARHYLLMRMTIVMTRMPDPSADDMGCPAPPPPGHSPSPPKGRASERR